MQLLIAYIHRLVNVSYRDVVAASQANYVMFLSWANFVEQAF